MSRYGELLPFDKHNYDRYYSAADYSVMYAKHVSKSGYYGNKVSPTAYERHVLKVTMKRGDGAPYLRWGSVWFNRAFTTYGVPASVSNKALAKVDEKLRIADSFFEDWYERKQAYDLLTTVGRELLTFVRNYKNPKYYKKKMKRREVADLPAAWLTYQFGIVPMMGTVDRALTTLSNPFPVWEVEGTTGFNHTELPMDAHQGQYTGTIRTTHKGIFKYGCRVTGFNPNSALAGATGLNEPFSSAWNVIPWGWAVDYFVNVGDLLSNFENNHPGLHVVDWYRTLSYTSSTHASGNPIYDGFYDYSVDGTWYTMIREPTSRPNYRLELKFPMLGTNKAANLFSAIALTMKGKAK